MQSLNFYEYYYYYFFIFYLFWFILQKKKKKKKKKKTVHNCMKFSQDGLWKNKPMTLRPKQTSFQLFFPLSGFYSYFIIIF